MFVIRLSDELEEEGAVDSLIHEWAHALAWNLEHDRLAKSTRMTREHFDVATHGPDWGVAYSRVYLVLAEEIARVKRERRLASRTRT
jgi:hypothetical protein